MKSEEHVPSVVLICHAGDRLDLEGLACWLASTLRLAGLIVIHDRPARLWGAAQREIRRSGWIGFADVLAFRAYAWLRLRRRDARWKAEALGTLRARYPADLRGIPRLDVSDPNADAARAFLASLQPDLLIARCKRLLKPAIFRIPRAGSFALHPGVCPEYRNAHGCFWALVNRDLGRVGMTLLQIDEGVDTGPIYLQAGCPIDEVADSHVTIQYRVVLENLDAIGRTLLALGAGERLEPVAVNGRRSAVWGQPRLSAYLKWKRLARRSRTDANRIAALS